MKHLIILASFFFATNITFGQVNPVNEFNQKKIKIIKQSMLVLASWGAANCIYSGFSAGNSNGSEKYFHNMNVIWGGVNLGLGAIGYLFTKSQYGLSYSQSLQKQSGVEKVFLFNAGLDVAYIMGGVYLNEKKGGSIINQDRNNGYGRSIMLQGSALFLFDGIMYLIHENHGKKLYKFADKIQVGITLSGIGCMVRL